MNTKLFAPLVLLPSFLLGCAASTGTAPTTQQITATEATITVLTRDITTGLQLAGVLKGNTAADANALQAAVTTATSTYNADITANIDSGAALADAVLAGVASYEATVKTSP